jgi:hypothetical protein
MASGVCLIRINVHGGNRRELIRSFATRLTQDFNRLVPPGPSRIAVTAVAHEHGLVASATQLPLLGRATILAGYDHFFGGPATVNLCSKTMGLSCTFVARSVGMIVTLTVYSPTGKSQDCNPAKDDTGVLKDRGGRGSS